MVIRWSELGFMGSLLLAGYGLLYFLVYLLPPALLAPGAVIAMLVLLGLLAWVGGILLSFGMVSLWTEFGIRSALLSLLLGIASWTSQSLAHLFLALGQYVNGTTLYGMAVQLLMLTFFVWGVTFIIVRGRKGAQERYTFYAGILFLINAFIWVSYLGVALLTLTGIICALSFTPPPRLVSLIGFNSTTRFRLAQLGLLLLTLYTILAIKWTVNGFFPLPLPVAAALNALSLACIWLAIPGLSLLLHHYEVHRLSRFAGLALVIGIPSWVLLSLTDLYWLYSNIAALIDPALALSYYYTAFLFWGWSAIPLLIWAGLAGLAFLVVWRSTEAGKDVTPWHLPLGLLLLASAVLWLLGLGFYPLIPAALLLLMVQKHEGPKDW